MSNPVDQANKHPYWTSATPQTINQESLRVTTPEGQNHFTRLAEQISQSTPSPSSEISFTATPEISSKSLSRVNFKRTASFIQQIKKNVGLPRRSSSSFSLQIASQEVIHEWQCFDEEMTAQINSIPKASLNTKKFCTLTEPWSLDINNNGLHACENDLIFCEEKPVYFNRLGKLIILNKISHYKGLPINSEKSHAYYDKKTKMLYSSDRDAIYHDHIKISGGNGLPVIATLCDGCDKGVEVAQAAVTASEMGQQWTEQHLGQCWSNHDVYHLLANAVKEAQHQLKNLKKANGEETCKDTTYLQFAAIGSKLYYLNIGDGAIFVFRKSEDQQAWQIFYLTCGSRGTSNARMAGGFLRCSTQIAPEVRNVKIGEFDLQENDVVFICSDGVTDNLMPDQKHLKPSDIDIIIDSNEWRDVNPNDKSQTERLIDYQMKKLAEIVKDCEGAEIQDKILYYIMDLQAQKMPLFLTDIIAKETEWRMIPAKGDDAACGGFIYRS